MNNNNYVLDPHQQSLNIIQVWCFHFRKPKYKINNNCVRVSGIQIVAANEKRH